MEPHEVLAKAWAEVELAGLPETLHQVAFREAVSLLSGPRDRQVATTPPAPSPEDKSAPQPGTRPRRKGAASEVFEKFSEETSIPVSELEDVFHFEGETVQVIGPARKLGENRADQSRRIVLLLAGAYYYALDQEQVDIGVVRDECKRLKCFDSNNFSGYAGDTAGVVVTGTGRSKNVRMKSDAASLGLLKTAISEVRGVKADRDGDK